jgi:hypothetical protein
MAAVGKMTAVEFAQRNGIGIVSETSALTGENISELFDDVAKAVVLGERGPAQKMTLLGRAARMEVDRGCGC